MTGPIQLQATIVGADTTAIALRGLSERARGIVRNALDRCGITVQNNVKFKYLSGQALDKRTGRLINSINLRQVERGNEMTAIVGTRVPYGRFWELGFHGSEHVRDYVRRLSGRSTFGRFVERKRAKLSQGIGFVRAHTRNVNQPARPFLKPGLDLSRAFIREEFERATVEIGQTFR